MSIDFLNLEIKRLNKKIDTLIDSAIISHNTIDEKNQKIKRLEETIVKKDEYIQAQKDTMSKLERMTGIRVNPDEPEEEGGEFY